MSRPFIEWNHTGRASERVISFSECPAKGERLHDYDGYGRITYRCEHCRGYGGHHNVTKVTFVRRPEFDAPTPENPRVTLTGQVLYTAFRAAWNAKAVRRGHQAGLPRWKNLKPWVTKVWDTAAETINKEVQG